MKGEVVDPLRGTV
jgi:hypothetical protein